MRYAYGIYSALSEIGALSENGGLGVIDGVSAIVI
jgi:hypothetical protein